MAVDYERMVAVARRLITENGRTIVIRRLRNTATDPAKPWRGNADPDVGGAGLDPITLNAVAVPPGSMSDLGFKVVSPDLVQRVSQVYVAAPPDPAVDLSDYDEVVDGGTRRVVQLDELRPADLTLLYFIMVSG